MDRTLVMILAGGQGSRLMPLTEDRAKPAVPFGARYRIIDFVLSNFVNSAFYKIVVLTQYKSQSLNAHLSRAWHLSRVLGHYVEAVPAQQRTGLSWYKGSADAVYQSLHLITDEEPEHLAVFGGDHIYKMDVRQMLRYHQRKNADLTIAAIPVPVEEAHAFGIIEVDNEWRMVGFEEKPKKNVKEIPGRPGWALASMGNYFFKANTLVDLVRADAENEESAHDFGKNILPMLFDAGGRIYVYDFARNNVPGQSEREVGYWRDVGTIKAYYDATMDLISVHPVMDMYNRRWPIRTDYRDYPPVKFVHAQEDRVGIATESLVSEGCIISGGRISRSVLSPQVRVNSYSLVEGCIIYDGVDVGRYSRLRRTIVEKHVQIPPGTHIGYDHDLDRERGLTVTPEGIVVVPKGYVFD